MYGKRSSGILKFLSKKMLVIMFCGMLFACSAQAKMTKEAHTYYQNALQAESTQEYQKALTYVQMAINANQGMQDATLLIKMGGLYTEIGEWDKALEVYKKATTLRPDDAFIQISIGNIYQQKQDYQNAYNAYYQAMCIYPDYQYNYLNLANMKNMMGQNKEAIDYYKKFTSIYPDHIDARDNLASVYLKENEPQLAADEYAYVYTKFPSDFKNYTGYGVALLRTQDYTNAVEILKKAIAQDDTDYASHANLALAYTKLEKDELALAEYEKVFQLKPDLNNLRLDYANLLADMQKYDNAISQYKLYSEYEPKNYTSYYNLGVVYNRMGQYKPAIENLEKALELNPKNDAIKQELAKTYHSNKNYKEAVELYSDLLSREPDNMELVYNKALASHALGDYEVAINLYKKLLAFKENEKIKEYLLIAYISQADVFVDKKNYKQALNNYWEVLKYDADNADIYAHIANTYQQMGIKSKCIENYEKALEINPDDEKIIAQYAKALSKYNDMENSKILLQRIPKNNNVSEYIENGEKLLKEKKYKEAIEQYEQAVSVCADNESLWIKLGNAYKADNNLTKAKSSYEKAISLNKNNSDALFNLGLVCAQQQDLVKAKKYFNDAIASNDKNAFAYYALALTYEKEQNVSEAIKNYEKFLELTTEKSYKDSVTTKINLLKLKEKKK